MRGFVHEVIIGCGNEIIARHKRSYLSADMIFDPLHFLPLIEQKVDLSRFGSAPLIAYSATKEMNYGTNTDG